MRIGYRSNGKYLGSNEVLPKGIDSLGRTKIRLGCSYKNSKIGLEIKRIRAYEFVQNIDNQYLR